MKNVKDEVYSALRDISENVTDVYPKEWADDVNIQYSEEDNSVYEFSTNLDGTTCEDKAKVRYRIDIWARRSTSMYALAVDEAMKKVGLKRTGCQDVPDPSGMKHKQMRYEGIIDEDSDYVYWS